MLKEQAYEWAFKKTRAQVERQIHYISTLANITAILKEYTNYFWIGFYFVRDDYMFLGPFQGSPACVKLDLTTGVCAAAVKQNKIMTVNNVHEFPGHIACDARSNSEIVIPVYDNANKIKAVLDIDSINYSEFDEIDKIGLVRITTLLSDIWPNEKSNDK